jgi:hypothetical protein
MSYKVLETAVPGYHLDGRQREEPLPTGVECKLLEAGPKGHGYHRFGDRWVEYFYDTPNITRIS